MCRVIFIVVLVFLLKRRIRSIKLVVDVNILHMYILGEKIH